MSDKTKQQLKVENNSSFPNNNTGFITPDKLRTFNEDIIDSLVSNDYTGSVDNSIDLLNQFTSSVVGVNTGSLLETASVNLNVITFTKGDSSQFSITVDTGSIPSGLISGSSQVILQDTTGNLSGSRINGLVESASIATNARYVNVQPNSINSNYFPAFTNGTGLNTTVYIDTTGYTYNPALNQLTISSISASAVTASVSVTAPTFFGDLDGNALTATNATSASYAVTASYALNAQTIQTGSLVTTSSFNEYTQSVNTRLTGLDDATASLQSSVDQLEIFSGSTEGRLNNIEDLTGSLLETASNDFSQVTFTKVDGQQFTLDTTPRQVWESVKNGNGQTLFKGTPVYASGSVGNAQLVFPASASVDSTMPAVYVLAQDLDPAEEGYGYTHGFINGVNTSLFNAGDAVYVGENGGFTNVRPTGTNLIQKLGTVVKVDASNGSGVIQIDSIVSVPNIQEGYTWVGDSNGVAQPQTTSSIAEHLLTQNNTFTGLQTFNDIAVNGTASIAYIEAVTGSAKIIGDAFIILNNNTPTERYAGIIVQDSGSTNTTASFQFDGLTNDWFYEYTGSDPTNFGVAMFGPEYGTKGSPIYPTENRVLKGNGGHHVIDTNITDDGTTVSINSNTEITGSLLVNGNTPIFSSNLSSLNAFTESANNRLNNIELTTQSLESSVSQINTFTQSADTRITDLETFSSSLDAEFVTQTELAQVTGALENSVNTKLDTGSYLIDSASFDTRIDQLETFSSSLDTNFVSETEFGTYTQSNDEKLNSLIAQTGSYATTGSNTFTGSQVINGTLTASLSEGYVWVGDSTGTTYEVSTGSFGGGGADLTSLNLFTQSADSRLNNLELFTQSQESTNTELLNASSSFAEKFDTIGTQSGSWGGGGGGFPYTGDAQISGSLGVTGSFSGYVNTLTVASSTASINFNDGNMFILNIPTGSVTHINPTNVRAGQVINLQLNQGTPTTGSIEFAPSVKFAGGYPFVATTTGSAIDFMTFVSLDGTNVLATGMKNLL